MADKIFYNTTASLKDIPPKLRSMLQYIEIGTVTDDATKLLDSEVTEARLKDEWRTEYMLTIVHDRDVFVDGYDSGLESGYNSRQPEVDSLTSIINAKDEEIAKLKAQIGVLDEQLGILEVKIY